MHKHLLLIFILFCFACNSTEGNKKGGEEAAARNKLSPPVTAIAGNTGAFYKRMEGTVAGKAVVVHVSKFHNIFLANYYYKEHGQPINLYLRQDTVLPGDSIELVEYGTPPNYQDGKEIKWRLLLTANGAKGRWIDGTGENNHTIILKEEYPEGSHLFNVIGYQDSLVVPLKKDTAMARSQEMILEPADAALAGNWFRNGLLKSIWGDSSETSSLTLSQLIEKSTRDFIGEYKAEVDTMRQQHFFDDSSSFHSLNYENLMNANLVYNDNNFVVMNVSSYLYTGGAHGISGSSMICYDIAQKRGLTLADILTIDSARLQRIVEKNFRILYKLRPADPLNKILFENKLPANDNFYFTHKGLGFVYQPYEAAAYVYGIIDVFIPFSDLKPYLAPEFAQRLGL